MGRPDKNDYYLNIAEAVLGRGTCLRRNYGAVIVNNDEIISTGYNGAPRGRQNCIDIGRCRRQELNVPRGTKYELCRSVHAEQNAIIAAARKDMIGSTIYIVGKEEDGSYVKNGEPCTLCKRMLINAGIKYVVLRDSKDSLRIIPVSNYINNDDSLADTEGY